jgi:tripartite-type tricarboxylate transporter receptor subunit TctC
MRPLQDPLRKGASKIAAALAVGLAACAGGAQAAYPDHPVKLIIPFPPGGSNDIVGRMMGNQLAEKLGQAVVVENTGGAGGTIGTGNAAKAQPDGYTLVLISVAYTFNSSLYKTLPYDPAKSFTPVAMLASGPVAMTVYPGLPVNNLKELIALAKAQPGKLLYASAGVGSFQHLASELFRIQTGTDIVHVPYKGGGPATLDVMGGHAQINMGALVQALPHIRTGKLKVLATSGAKRSSMLPDVPTALEAGLPGYEATNWWGILAPAGTPAAIVNKLNGDINTILAQPDTQKRFLTEGTEVEPMSAAQFTKIIETDTVKWARVVKSANIKPE